MIDDAGTQKEQEMGKVNQLFQDELAEKQDNERMVDVSLHTMHCLQSAGEAMLLTYHVPSHVREIHWERALNEIHKANAVLLEHGLPLLKGEDNGA